MLGKGREAGRAPQNNTARQPFDHRAAFEPRKDFWYQLIYRAAKRLARQLWQSIASLKFPPPFPMLALGNEFILSAKNIAGLKFTSWL